MSLRPDKHFIQLELKIPIYSETQHVKQYPSDSQYSGSIFVIIIIWVFLICNNIDIQIFRKLLAVNVLIFIYYAVIHKISKLFWAQNLSFKVLKHLNVFFCLRAILE